MGGGRGSADPVGSLKMSQNDLFVLTHFRAGATGIREERYRLAAVSLAMRKNGTLRNDLSVPFFILSETLKFLIYIMKYIIFTLYLNGDMMLSDEELQGILRKETQDDP